MTLKKTALLFILGLLFQEMSNAQQINDKSYSIFTGGMIIGKSHLLVTRASYEFKKFSFLTDFSYDDYSEIWKDGSKSKFQILALSLAGRYYLKPQGRGLFAEIFTGFANSAIITKENSQTKKMSGYSLFSGGGFGWRIGKKPTGIFGEIAYRFLVNWNEILLYTTEHKPLTIGLETFSYQTWHEKKGESVGQIYIGLGFSF